MIYYSQDKEKEIEKMTKLMNGKECIAVVIGKLSLEEMVASNITTILRAELSRQHKTNGRERLIFIIKVN